MSTTPRQLPEPAPLAGGGRVEMRLLPGPTPVYEARWFTEHGVFTGRASLDSSGEAEVSVDSVGAPEWLVAWTAALLRVIARDHQPEAAWPRRLTRWRQAPRPAEG